MIGGAVAFRDVKSFDADLMRDGDRQDVDGRGGGGLGVCGALQERGELAVALVAPSTDDKSEPASLKPLQIDPLEVKPLEGTDSEESDGAENVR